MSARKRRRTKQSSNQQKEPAVKRRQWLEWCAALIIGIIGSISAWYLIANFMEPMDRDTFSYYYVLNTIPVSLSGNTVHSANELTNMFSIVVKPDNALNINNIKISGVGKMDGYSMYCSDNDINQSISQKLRMKYNADVGTVTFTGIPTIPGKSNLIVNILGRIDNKKVLPIIVLANNKMLWPVESKLVSESQLFLAKNWRFIFIINLLCILSIYYSLKLRLAK